jgi:uncharacterized protein (TIGR03118 family)
LAALSCGNANAKSSFDWLNLTSDLAGVARHSDSNLINPWGIALASNGFFWINDNGTGVATTYKPNGVTNSLTVTIPPSASNAGAANPTGIVRNNTSVFKVTQNANSQPSSFIFVSEDGAISGWNSALDPTNAIIAVDNGASNAIYKGATLATVNPPLSGAGPNVLYVTNFHAGKVEMYDGNFARLDTNLTFVDPTLPAGYAPFGIQTVNNHIYVSYALQDANAEDDVAGPGNGYIDVYTSTGAFVKRLVSNANLNSPWGMALGPSNFGGFNGGLFVGNFGDGKINVYNPTTGVLLGTLKQIDGTPLQFDGLWALYFNTTTHLVFTAGLGGESHGLYGVIFVAQQ